MRSLRYVLSSCALVLILISPTINCCGMANSRGFKVVVRLSRKIFVLYYPSCVKVELICFLTDDELDRQGPVGSASSGSWLVLFHHPRQGDQRDFRGNANFN